MPSLNKEDPWRRLAPPGITVAPDGHRFIDKRHRGIRIGMAPGRYHARAGGTAPDPGDAVNRCGWTASVSKSVRQPADGHTFRFGVDKYAQVLLKYWLGSST